jgi:peptidoglycan hydrolase CwlO-like protein
MSSNNNREKIKKLENELRNMKKKLFNVQNNLQQLNNTVKNNSNKNKNVTTWMNASMSASNKNGVKPSKRAYIKTNVTNGKIRTVYNRNGLKNWLSRAKNVGKNAKQPSPLTRKSFGYNNIKKYPPRLIVKMKK